MKKFEIKHLILFCLFSIHTMYGNTQTSTSHKFQMGIVLSSGLNFNKMNTKIANGNIGTDLSIGMNIIKNLNDNLGILTGFEFDFSRQNYTFNDSTYIVYNDSRILTKSDNSSTSSIFRITDRTQTPIYLSVPTMFVFRTDYIGYKRFFAKFGMRHSFILKSMTNDKGFSNNNSKTSELTRMELPTDLSIYKGSIGIASGMEWNYYGTSTMVFELGYYYGINNIHRTDAIIGDVDKNKSLFEKTDKTSYTTLRNTQNQLTLKVSFIF